MSVDEFLYFAGFLAIALLNSLMVAWLGFCLWQVIYREFTLKRLPLSSEVDTTIAVVLLYAMGVIISRWF